MNKPPVVFIPHGGGPLPLLGDPSHQGLVKFLSGLAPKLGQPSAIVIISAHWEEKEVTVTSNPAPELIYDYYGFPAESYQISYPSPGAPDLAQSIYQTLAQHDIPVHLDVNRGLDHGVFVPMKLIYPNADIPCLQISLLNNLDPAAHLALGRALQSIRDQNVLFIGSGFSFHNLREFFSPNRQSDDPRNQAFEDWLIETCTDLGLSEQQREQHLINWEQAPHARYCHPREEHLLPLHVCAGLGAAPAELIYRGLVTGKQASAYLWS